MVITKVYLLTCLTKGAANTIFAATSHHILAEKGKYKGTYLILPGLIEEPVRNGPDDELVHERWVT